MAAVQKTVGPYTDPDAAHAKCMRLQAAGMKNVHMRKGKGGWIIYYVEYENSLANPSLPIPKGDI